MRRTGEGPAQFRVVHEVIKAVKAVGLRGRA